MSIRLLLLEDNPGDARLIREMLGTRNDIEVVWVDRLSDVLDSTAQPPFDAVTLDLRLTGLQLSRTVQRKLDHAELRESEDRFETISHIARSVVMDQHDGTLDFETTFVMRLPLNEPAQPETVT